MRIVKLFGVLASVLLCMSLPTLTMAQTTHTKPTQLLFVLLSKKGQIKAITGKPKEYTLTLSHVNPVVIYFTNRPIRYTNQIPLKTFITEWTTGTFQKVPPNAVMEAIRLRVDHKRGKDKSVSYAVELLNPHYNAKTAKLTFTIKALPGKSMPIPNLAESDYVALFIDNIFVCAACVN